MLQRCALVVRDKVSMGRPCTDEGLMYLDCYYKSPVFSWDGSLDSLDSIIDDLHKHFNHFLNWSAELIVVN